MTDTRTVTLPDGHTDIETLINGIWAITKCTQGDEMNKLFYGVFEWNADAHYYKEENAIAIYMNEKLAQKRADELNNTNNDHVVRGFYIEVEEEPEDEQDDYDYSTQKNFD